MGAPLSTASFTRLWRYAGAAAAFTGLTLAAKACSDLTAPAGVNDVSVQFRLAAGQTRIDLIVGDSVRPDVVVMLGGVEQSRARYVFTSKNPDVISVYAGGDSIMARDRGTDTLIVTLVGTTIGNNRVNPNSRTADTIIVAAVALGNAVAPATMQFQALSARDVLIARSFGRNGQTVGVQNVIWRSTNPAVVSVAVRDDSTADVTSVGNGTADVYAVFGGGVDSAFATVTVSQQLKRYLLATPVSANLRSINETMTVSARAVDSLNNTINVAGGAPAPAPPAFVSDNAGKIDIDPTTGVMTARANTDGTPVRITATVGGTIRSDTLQATVTQVAASLAIQSADTIRLLSVGDRAQDIGVIAPDALGTQVPSSSINWTSADPTRVQVVGNALATITAQGTGTVVVRARADQQIDSVVVVVTNDAAAVTLAPKPLHLRSLDETQTMTATVTNTAGTPLTGVSVTWISRDSGIVQPQASPGVMLARAVGEAQIVVTTPNGRSDSTLVRVSNAPDTVNIIPPTLTLASIGDVDSTFAVDFKNARGVALPRTSANWSSQDVTVARAIGGAITATGAGDTYVVAVSPENPARRDSVLVTVTNAAATVNISPTPAPTMTALGATTAFTAVVRNASGSIITGAPVTWTVPAGGAFVSIDAGTGVATAVANGTATVRATSNGAFAEVSVTVAQATSTSQSTVIPAATTLVADGTSSTTVTIQLKDANGNDLTFGGSTVVASATRGTLGPVTDNGLGRYTTTLTSGTAAGPASISATAGGQGLQNTGVVSFVAGAATQYIVTVSPGLTPLAGAPVTISARLADAFGNTVATAGSVVTWSSTGGGSFSAPTTTTDGTGLATVTFTTSTSANPHTVTATTGSLAGTSPVINTQAGSATQYGVTPATTSPAAGSAVVITAQLLDGNGNPVPLAGQTVTWTKSDPNGVFSNGTSVTNSSGVAMVTLTTHTVSNTATTVTATTGTLTGTSAMITTVPGSASQLTLTQPPSATAQSGVAFATQPVLQLRDANGNAVPQANISVTATITAGGGTLGGVTMVQTDVNGAATFTDLSISGVNGGRTLTFSSSGLSSATAGVTIGAGQAALMALWAGNGQSAPAGTSVTTAPAVVVRDASNNAVAGVNVTFTVTGGGGTTSPPSGGTVATDASGVATLTSWTLGTLAGANSLEASVAGLSGSPVTFSATGTTGAATQMTTTIGAQTATVNTPVSTDPWVLVRDANNNPVPGVSVTFTVASGGGSISSPTGSTVVTNASGIAALSSWTVGTTAGANSIDATSAGLPTVTFAATATAGPATYLAVNAGNGQSATVGTAVATAPSVQVRDAYNNPVALTSVTFAVTGGGGSISSPSGNTVVTDASGIASLTSWTLGSTAGANTVSATAAGLIGSPVTFSATGTVDVVSAAQSSVLRTGGDGVTADGSAASEITVTLRDQFNNTVSGKTVALDDAGSTSVISAPSGTTSNILGEVRFVVTNATAETVTYTATASDPGAIVLTQVAQVTFVTGGPVMVATTGTSQNAVIGTNVAAPPAVLVRDGNLNPLPGVSVTFTLTATGGGGASITPASPAVIVTDAAGIAALTSWTVGQTAGTNNNSVTATAPGILGSPVTFTASGDNPDPDLTGIAPMSATQGEIGLQLVLTGTGFIPSSTVSIFSPSTGITINSTVVDSPTQITANITIAPSAATGTRLVRVTNPGPGGGSSSDRLLTIVAPSAPTLTSLSPASGGRTQTLNVVLTGTGFVNGVTTVNAPAGITLNSTTVNSSTQITANITIPAAAALGAYNFTVTNTTFGTSAAQVFTVTNPAPTLTSLSPASANRLQTLDVVFTGTGFLAGVSSLDVGAGITVNSTTVNSSTQITGNLTIDGAASTGARNVTVTNAGPGGGTSAAQTFTVTNPVPTLTTVSPAVGVQGQTAMPIVLTGTGFVSGASVTFTPATDIVINSATVDSPTQITLSVSIAAGAVTGSRSITVTNGVPGGGTSGAQVFDINAPPVPTLSALAPAAADRLQTLDVVLTGSGFVSGVSTVNAPAGITVNSTVVNSATQITANITVTDATALGANSIMVANFPPGGTSGAQTLTVSNPTPTITLVSPDTVNGAVLGTTVTPMTVTGAGYIATVTTVDFVEAGVTIGSVTVDSQNQITLSNVQFPITAVTTNRTMRVTNPGRAPATYVITVNP